MIRRLIILLLIVGCENSTEPEVHPLVDAWEFKESYSKQQIPEGYFGEGSESQTNLDTFFVGEVNTISMTVFDSVYTFTDSSFLYLSATYIFNDDGTFAFVVESPNSPAGEEYEYNSGYGTWSTNSSKLTLINLSLDEDEEEVAIIDYSINGDELRFILSPIVFDDGMIIEGIQVYQRQ